MSAAMGVLVKTDSVNNQQREGNRDRTKSLEKTNKSLVESQIKQIFDGRWYPDNFKKSESEKLDDSPIMDEDEHMSYTEPTLIMDKYKLNNVIGEGAFGKVISTYDINKEKEYAMKIVKNVKKYRESTKYEIYILKTILNSEIENKYCVELIDFFVYFGHACLVFKKYGMSVYDFMSQNSFYPFPREHAKVISYQLCSGIKFLQNHKILHIDLKPENMVFVNHEYEIINESESRPDEKILKNCDIKIIDFGNAIFESDHHSKIICTRHYRPPEVILELDWDKKVDVWSAGCIIFEVYTGITMFKAHSNTEHLAMIEVILARFPRSFLKKSELSRYFTRDYELAWERLDRDQRRKVEKCKRLEDYFRYRHSDDDRICKLLFKMLEIDPEYRINITKCLDDRYFRSHE